MATRRRMHNEINAGSMADIAFLLLIFFLVTTTITEDKGVLVKLPEWTPDPPPALPMHKRNVFSVMVNAENQLLVRDEPTNITELRAKAKNFILNPDNNPKMSERPALAIISLRNDRGTRYESYIEVYNELKAAYNELWNEEAMKKFGKQMSDLEPFRQKTIKEAIPMVLSEAEPTAFGDEK